MMKPHANGIRKAAILVASLSRSAADRLLDQIDPEQARSVRQTVVDLGPIDPDEQRRIIDEFFRLRPMVPAKQHSGIELDGTLARRLSLAVPRFAPEDLAQPDTSDGKPFRFLHEAEGEKLAGLLVNERPQTIALVLSHLPPERAGSVLARLAPTQQVEVIRRLVDLEETDPEILHEVEQALESRFSEQKLMQRRRKAGSAAVEGILKASDGRVGMQILGNLAAHDRQLAERFSPERLEFEELVHLDEATLATILKAAEPELVMLALVGAPQELIERILRKVPESDANVLRRQLEHVGPTRLSDVEEARRRIGEVSQRLVLEGRIRLPGKRGAAEFVDQNP
jgi:flagellar motor switch protein FliG